MFYLQSKLLIAETHVSPISVVEAQVGAWPSHGVIHDFSSVQYFNGGDLISWDLEKMHPERQNVCFKCIPPHMASPNAML